MEFSFPTSLMKQNDNCEACNSSVNSPYGRKRIPYGMSTEVNLFGDYMQIILDALLLNEDIVSLKEMISNDPLFKTMYEQVPLVMKEIHPYLDLNMPTLDLDVTSVQEANRWISQLQAGRDKICQYEIILRTYEYNVGRYWTLAQSICMVQPQLEGLRSNEQRKAYIDQVFKDLVEAKNYIEINLKKLNIISDNIQQAYYSFNAQQKNVQLLATVHRSYGVPTA